MIRYVCVYQGDAEGPRNEVQADLQPDKFQPCSSYGSRRWDASSHGPATGNGLILKAKTLRAS